MGRRAVFFDRDGTLIEDKHYLKEVAQIEYFPDSFTALKALQDKDFLLFIVTNQSGIGRGFFSEADMHAVHDQIIRDYRALGIKISGIAFCPHTPDDECVCRKPKATMLQDLARQFDLDLGQSFMVGDKVSDVEAGENAGAAGLLLSKEKFANLTDITRHILAKNS